MFLAMQVVSACIADEFVPVPALTGRVVDAANVLTQSEKTQLESTLTTFEHTKGAQLVILLVNTTQPESIEQYSLRVVEQWKLGRKGIDDGVLLLLAMQDRAFRMEVGYGLEGVLPDAIAKRILEEVLKPQLQQGQVAQGLHSAVDAITKVINGEPLPAPSQTYSQEDPFVFLVPLVMGGMFFAAFLKVWGIKSHLLAAFIAATVALMVGIWLVDLIVGLIAWLFVFILGISNSHSSGGVYSGGRGSGGWSSGGGFSGGGGSFGGGGASGRW